MRRVFHALVLLAPLVTSAAAQEPVPRAGEYYVLGPSGGLKLPPTDLMAVTAGGERVFTLGPGGCLRGPLKLQYAGAMLFELTEGAEYPVGMRERRWKVSYIVNLRGTNGSGKTTVARAMVPPSDEARFQIAEHAYVTKSGAARVKPILAYRVGDMVLIGRYDTACGGCDGLPDVRTAYRAALTASQMEGVRGVVLEGLMISGIYQSVVDELGGAARALPRPATLVWAYMDTPLDACVDRVRTRSNRPPSWDPRNIISKHRAVVRTRERAIADGHPVVDVASTEDAAGTLLRIVRGEESLDRYLVARPRASASWDTQTR